jgi:hypothetical protein
MASSVHAQDIQFKAIPRYDPMIVPAQAKVPAKVPMAGRPFDAARDEGDEMYLRTELPGPQRFFQRDSESAFFERIAQETKRQSGGRAIFPQDPVVAVEPFTPRRYPKMTALVEPSYVCHTRLLFEQPNFERTGYDFGVLTPAICLGVFYYDAAMMPYHIWSDLRHHDDCNVGKCLPGDPAPFRVNCERFSVTGLVGQGAFATGVGFLFP